MIAAVAAPVAAATLLDSFLPTSNYTNAKSIRIQAPPRAVRAAIRTVTPGDVPGLPAFVAVTGGPRLSLTPQEREFLRLPMIEALRQQNLVVLGERAGDELVMGGIGRIWDDGYLSLRDAAAFRAFQDPRYARVAMNVRVRPDASGGTLLAMETRVLCPDPAARKQLDRYWRLWSPGVTVVRDQWLSVVRHRAESAGRR